MSSVVKLVQLERNFGIFNDKFTRKCAHFIQIVVGEEEGRRCVVITRNNNIYFFGQKNQETKKKQQNKTMNMKQFS